MKLVRSCVVALLGAVSVLLAGVFAATPAHAASGAIAVQATVNDVEAGGSSGSHPVRLNPAQDATMQVRVTNNGSEPVTVRRVELSGRVVGLTFFSFATSVNLTVPAEGSDSLSYTVDLTGLGGQATGLMGGAVTIYDDHHRAIAREKVVTDVRGSLFSVYGLFGFALLLLTILALLDLALAIARHRLPANRWRRATRATTPGIGIGLVLVFTLSAARVWVPDPQKWLLAAAGFAIGFFVIGYLTPTPVGDDDVDELAEDELDEPAAGVDSATEPSR